MRENWYFDWLFDDWQKAVRRSLTRAFTPRQLAALRGQRRVGQAARWALLFLPFLLLLSFLAPDADVLLLEGVFAWNVLELALLVAHIGLGIRHGVSYSWAFHHSRPVLLHGLAARPDLKFKACLAAFFATATLLSMVALL